MISVIVPVYNAQNTLIRCIQSLLSQDVSDREFIFVNDGSTDESLKILKEYAEKYSEIKVIDKPNGGVSGARNVGLRVANGEYIVFLDSDDYYISNSYLKNLYNNMQSRSDVDLVIAGYTVLSENAQTPIVKENHVETITELAHNYLSYRDPNVISSPCNKMFRKKLVTSFFNEKMTFGEDAVFVLEYLKQCQTIVFCDDDSYGYVCMNSSTTEAFRKKKLYDINQTNLYHSAILSFWKGILNEDFVFDYYVKLRTEAVLAILKKVLSEKGLLSFLKTDFGELLPDPFLEDHKNRIILESKSNYDCKIAKWILKKKIGKLKYSILISVLKQKMINRSQASYLKRH